MWLRSALIAVLFTTALGGERPGASPPREQLAWVVRAINTRSTTLLDLGAHFTTEFFTTTSAQGLVASFSAIREAGGPLAVDRIDDETATSLVAVARGANERRVRIALSIDDGDDHRIASLHVAQAAELDPTLRAPAAVLAAAEAIAPGGVVAVGAYDLDGPACRPMFGANTDRPMAIASLFKLYVLLALAEEVAEGRCAWDREVALRDEAMSLSPLAARPEGERITVAELAREMIGRSDNSAADHLIALVGRARIEAEIARRQRAPGENLPLLTTWEALWLTAAAPPATQRSYREGSVAARRAILAQIPHGKDVRARVEAAITASRAAELMSFGWFASADDLCDLAIALRRLSDPTALAILRESPGPADVRDEFASGYKAGAARGLLGVAWDLERRRDGRGFFVALVVNDEGVAFDRNEAFYLLGAARALVARWP